MFSTNIKLAFRNLIRFRTYSILNIAGLAVGLALGIFAMLYIHYEYSFDTIHVNRDRMGKLLAFEKQGDNKWPSFQNSALTGELLKQETSEIEAYTRYRFEYLYIKKDNEPIGESGIYADENFFQFFDFNVKEGNPATMLQDPGSIVISERLAKKLFGDKPAINQTISTLLNNKPAVFKVGGIIKNVEHSTINFEYVIPLSLFLANNPWANDIKHTSCEMMFLLKPNTNISLVNNKIKKFLDSKDSENNSELFLHPLSEFNLYSYDQSGVRHMGKLLIVTLMSIIAALILAISCFNFINMAIAVGIKRYKEAGVKKVLGSSKKNIVLQFLAESVLICMIALFFSFILLETFLPLYNKMDQIHLAVDYGNIFQILGFILFATLVGIIAALYPALLLGSTSPVKILNRTANNSQKIGFSRQGLIVFQFFITILLTVGLFVFSKQSNYINSKDIGINRYNVLRFMAPNSILEQRNAFLSDLNAIPEISSVSWSSQNPIYMYAPTSEVVWEGKQANEKRDFSILKTDAAFINTMKVRLASGRFFSDSIASDSGSYVLNEEAIKCMHLTDPVGKTIEVNNKKGTIVGVVDNFNSVPLNSPYGPLIIINRPSEANTILIRFSGYKDVSRKKVEMVYKKYEQYIPFGCGLIEDDFNYLNIFAKNAATMLNVLSILALFLSCMGLFGLASFTIETRTKEIGIRKSNGASTISILRMFLKVYNKWILIASCIALPLAFLAWNTLLSTFFAFRIQFPLETLVITPLIVMLISWITVIWQSWKAASKNPVEALRYE